MSSLIFFRHHVGFIFCTTTVVIRGESCTKEIVSDGLFRRESNVSVIGIWSDCRLKVLTIGISCGLLKCKLISGIDFCFWTSSDQINYSTGKIHEAISADRSVVSSFLHFGDHFGTWSSEERLRKFIFLQSGKQNLHKVGLGSILTIRDEKVIILLTILLHFFESEAKK